MPTSHNISNFQSFTFIINSQNEIISENQSTISSDSNPYEIFLNGIVYDTDIKQLLSGFVLKGIDYVKQLEGSFVMFIRHKETFYILTDKVNSRKAFYALVEGKWHISNNIDNLPKRECHVSIDGIANYIANGVMLNGLTLYKEIKSTERASIHCIEKGVISIKRYWDLEFSYNDSNQFKESDYQQELEDLIVASIKRRFNSNSKTAISLSAGYDARGILGILHHSIKAPNIYCFSYALDKVPSHESDASVAKHLAEKCQYTHEIVQSYKGDFINLLLRNASEGKCLTNFSDELDAWHYLAENSGSPDIFVGDMNFGIGIPFKTMENIIEKLRLVESSGVKWLKRFIAKEVYSEICHSLDILTKNIIQKADAYSDLQDKMDYLYLDQRINHSLLTWRENICTQAGVIHIPYLDGEILEYISKLPPHLRNNKQMFRKTISELLPDLFSIPFATSLGYKVNWTKEIIKFKKPLIELLNGSSSRLDEFIGKEEIIGMIQSQSALRTNLRAFTYKTLRYLRRRINLVDKILRKISGPMANYVSSDIFIIRLILLRIYLATPSAESMKAE